MKKRIISILLVLVMIVGIIPFGAITASAASVTFNGNTVTGGTEGTDFAFDREYLNDANTVVTPSAGSKTMLTVLTSTPLTLSGTQLEYTKNCGVYVPEGVTAYITMNNCKFNGSTSNSFFLVRGTLYLTIESSNRISAYQASKPVGNSGIAVFGGANLYIDGTGSLDVNVTNGASAIGQSDQNGAGVGKITVNGGTLNLESDGNDGTGNASYYGGAAIGSSRGSASDLLEGIVINGGTVNATSYSGSALGFGKSDSAVVQTETTNITITGGTLNLISRRSVDAIGNGRSSSTLSTQGNMNINITGGNVRTVSGIDGEKEYVIMRFRRPTNGTSDVYMVTAGFDGISGAKTVSEVVYYEGGVKKNYGVNDMQTMDGKAYIWLPENALLASVTVDSTKYYFGHNVTASDTDNSVTGTTTCTHANQTTAECLMCGASLHVHAWSYSANATNDTITATCTAASCPDTDGGYLSIAAPADNTYTGSAISAVVDNKLKTTDIANVVYEAGAGSELTAGKPVNVGSYTARITFGSAVASASYNIEKKTLDSVTVGVTAPASGASVTTTATTSAGCSAQISWDPSDTTFDYNKEYTATLTLTADANHKFASTLSVDGWTLKEIGTDSLSAIFTKTFPITAKRKVTGITAPTERTLAKYCKTVYAAIDRLDYTMTVSLEGASSADLPLSWSCATYDPTPGAVNEFTWTADIGDYDANSFAMSGTVEIRNADYLPTAIDGIDKTKLYDGTDYDVSNLFSIPSYAGAASYSLVTGGTGEGTLTGNMLNITKIGTFYIEVNTLADGAYASGKATAVVTVKKGYGKLQVEAFDWVYGSTPTIPTVTSTTNDVSTVTYRYTNSNGYDSAVVPTNAGEYRVYISVEANDFYESVSVHVDIEITKAPLSVTAENKSTVYGNAAPLYTVTYAGFVNGDDKSDLGGTLGFDCAYAQFSDKGTYDITPKGYISDNYEITYNKGTLTVTPKPITVTIDKKTSVYGEDTVALTAQTDGIVNNDQNVYSLSTEASKSANAGSYDIKGTALDANYTITFVGETDAYVITKAQQIITIDTVTETTNCGITLDKRTVSAEGAISYESSDPTIASVDAATGKVTAHKHGSVIITLKAAETINYKPAEISYRIKVEHKHGTDWLYNDDLHWNVCACGDKNGSMAHTAASAPTCDEGSVCSVCGMDMANATGHSYSLNFHNDDFHWTECVCGATGAMTEHLFSEWTEAGTRECPTCKLVQTKSVPSAPSTPETPETPDTPETPETPEETTPVETTPAETTPVETTPAETTPAETTPAETTPEAETSAPTETEPADVEAEKGSFPWWIIAVIVVIGGGAAAFWLFKGKAA